MASRNSRLTGILFLCIGLVLLAVVLAQADPAALWQAMQRVGLAGLAVVLLIYTANFWSDVASWHVILDQLPFTLRWSLRLFAVRLVGEAWNNVTPTASVGGEPIKAWLLKSRYHIRMRDAGATLVLAKTTIVMSLSVFAGIGLVLLMDHARLAAAYGTVSAVGLLVLCVLCAAFFLMQRLQLSSVLARRIGGTGIGQRLAGVIAIAEDLDAAFVRFYSGHRRRLLASLALAFLAWLFGTLEIYYIMQGLGFPVTMREAWMIEALVQIVRTGTFFIPAGLGTQEGTLLLICATITGVPESGLALALVRRSRELVWIVAGLILAAYYAVTPARVAAQASGGE